MCCPVKKTFFGFALFVLAGRGLATPPHLDMFSVHDLDDFRGTTFLNFMLKDSSNPVKTPTRLPKNLEGLKLAMDADWSELEYTFPTWGEVRLALENFDTKNTRRVWNAFAKSEADLQGFVESMQGKTFTNKSLVNVMRGEFFSYVDQKYARREGETEKQAKSRAKKLVNSKKAIYGLSFFFSMAAKAGTLVVIDENNYFYNVGYQPGEVRSGRSYAASPIHPANDVSHKNYLKDLEEFLTDEDDQDRQFYEIILDILIDSDDRNYGKLSDLGQSVATDFVAVYVAELRRHLMKNLRPNDSEWGNDYIEVTLLTAYGSESGNVSIKVTDENGNATVRLQPEPMWEYWELNPETGRSGIGKTQRERRILQFYITQYMRKNHSQLVSKIESITGKHRSKDVFQGFAEFLNNYKTKRDLGRQAKSLRRAMSAFLEVVGSEAHAITYYIYERNEALVPKESDISWDGKRVTKRFWPSKK